jgi:hypothetical protein
VSLDHCKAPHFAANGKKVNEEGHGYGTINSMGI